jgi:hypothetical protein
MIRLLPGRVPLQISVIRTRTQHGWWPELAEFEVGLMNVSGAEDL